MTDDSLIYHPGPTEQFFRLFDQAAFDAPLCQVNLACLMEFDRHGAELPSKEDLKTFIAKKLPSLPCLRHYLKEDDGVYSWQPYQPDLENIIHQKTIRAGQLQSEILAALKSTLAYEAPWKVELLTGYDAEKFSLLWCVRHEVMDGGAMAAMLNVLFGDGRPAAFPLPSVEKASSDVPQKLLEPTCSAEDAGLFFENITPTSDRAIVGYQMPSRFLSAVGKKLNVSGNDIYLTAIAKAFWKWRKAYPLPVPENAHLPLIVPINLRKKGDKNIGNRFYAARLSLGEDFSVHDISKQMAFFREDAIRDGLNTLYRENPETAAAQIPTVEYFAATTSSFRVTKPLAWENYPLSRMVQVFNAVTGMPFYTMFSTYEPKGKKIKNPVSTLFFSLDSGVAEMETLPKLWKEALDEIIAASGADVSEFGDTPITPFA